MAGMMRLLGVLAFILLSAGGAAAQCASATEGYRLDWNNASWPSGSVNRTVTVNRNGSTPGTPAADPVTATFSVTGNTNRLIDSTPRIVTDITGGSGNSNGTLSLFANFATTSETVTIDVTFSRPVFNVQFDAFDIDYDAPSFFGSGGFRDTVGVSGATTLTSGFTVIPSLSTPYHSPPTTNTPPSSVYIAGVAPAGTGVGVGSSDNDEDFGNLTFRFTAPVRRVRIEYSNSFISSSNPNQQRVAIHDLNFCSPRLANVTATKTVQIVSENLEDTFDCANSSVEPGASALIPGSCVEYLITMSNNGLGSASALNLTDPLGPNHIFRSATVSGFGPPASYTLLTPATGTDCGSSACNVSLQNATLPAGSNGTITIRATVQ